MIRVLHVWDLKYKLGKFWVSANTWSSWPVLFHQPAFKENKVQPSVLRKTLSQQLYNIGAGEALFVLFVGLYKVTSAFFFYGLI